jgi:hypothetical protein
VNEEQDVGHSNLEVTEREIINVGSELKDQKRE